MNPESIYRHIGEVVRTRRKKLQPPLTQENLAQLVGISRASLANIETGRQNVLVHQLYLLAKALQLDPDDFLIPAESVAATADSKLQFSEEVNPKQKQELVRLIADAQATPKEEHGKQKKR